MASTPYISHVVNGYSRYDVPQNIAFTATPGLLYVGRCEFLNPRDVTSIQCGVLCRTEPAVVPTFTPYQVRLHRFFVPMQLYHPEMRVNAAQFDFERLSSNVYITSIDGRARTNMFFGHSGLLTQLGLAQGHHSGVSFLGSSAPFTLPTPNIGDPPATFPSGTEITLNGQYVNADPLLGYWDIVRSYYGYSQTGHFQIAFENQFLPVQQTTGPGFRLPMQYMPSGIGETDVDMGYKYVSYMGDLSVLDDYYETQFYPVHGATSRFYLRNTIAHYLQEATRRSPLFNPTQSTPNTITQTGEQFYKTQHAYFNRYRYLPDGKFSSPAMTPADMFSDCFPMAVVPSSPDRLSRTLPLSAGKDISIANLTTVRQLAVAARMQEYDDLLNAGGSRFKDWLKTFFSASVKHVDRPVLLYSKTLYINSQPIFNNAGQPGEGLGSYGGQMQCQDAFDKKAQRYCFDEPGYLMDLISIRPLYYWSRPIADYALYDGLDYFNPIFNEVGYQTIPDVFFGFPAPGVEAVGSNYSPRAEAKEPCFNEFRASYDYVFGDFMRTPSLSGVPDPFGDKIRQSWVQQRSLPYLPLGVTDTVRNNFAAQCRFVDMSTVNDPFATTTVDNFFINLYYNVTKKSLVSKQFATRLASR